ncbi:hypothetical protein L798_15689 [Zootermopsis nevadensis]|uniref:Uncharacterized protein n=1 Tax=Zootermopsis nevadensis TaxID=136037 RepID=A0A067QL80_ZOONE|nr:hypothetical protein L798_15689 [Zootermopsis nevadensis]
MIKRRTRNQVVETLHKGVVLTCIGVTLYGCFLLGMRFHKYFTVTRPMKKIKEVDENKHLLQEGVDASEKDLKDNAPQLKL